MKNNKNNIIETIKIWIRVLSFVDGSKLLYLLMFFGYTSIGTLGDFGVGYLLKQITNGIIADDSSLILKGLLVFIILSVSMAVLGWVVFHVFVSRTKMKAEYKIKMQMFRHLLDRPLPRKADAHSGDSLARLLNDSDSVANALSWDTLGILWPISSLLISGVVTLVMNWKIGILTLIIGVFFLFITSRVSVPMRKNNDGIKKSESKATQRMIDFLSAAGSVRIMGIEIPLIGKLEEATSEVKRLSYKNIMLNAWYSTLGSAVGIATTVMILGMGVYLVSRGEMETGNVLMIYQFSSSAVYSLVSVGRSLARFQRTAASAQRVFDILDNPEENKRRDLPEITSVKKESSFTVEMKNVSFKYREDLTYALKNITFSISRGEHVAVVGESGSGKSTFFKLLLGLYSINEGDIFIEGVNVKEISLKSMRKCFSYVSQDSPLFDGSITDNIIMGRLGSNEDDAINAAKLSGTHDFISAFPKGYQSEVGELGAKISGGQKQRIAITRAVIHDADILLLDEATSSLDSHNETKIQEALRKVAENKTMIVAAHRLSTVKEANRILVFKDGLIVENGTHKELIGSGGLYAELIRSEQIT